MAKKLYEEAAVQDIADAIREKTGSAETYKIAQMGGAVRGITGAETVTWHQCPEAVRNYLANVTYDPGDYSTSQIDSYAPANAILSNYKPIGKEAGGVKHYNEVPNIETPFAGGGTAGTLKPLDFLRWIQTQNGSAYAFNVRDLGGWACDGGTVKYGKLFRGGSVTNADRAVLVGQLGIQHELDLRGASEGGLSESPLGSGVRYTCAADYAWYSLKPADAWKVNLRCVFDAVTHNEPVYFHCAAGADRTGTLACVLEGLLGLAQSDVDKDYELTTFATGSGTDANARRRNEAEWKGLISEINGKAGNTFRDKCVTFAAELGFTASEINAFRAAMIDGTPETVTPSVSTYRVTYALSHSETSNSAPQTTEYQPYTAAVAPDEGYVIDKVSVKMGGADITNYAFHGTKVNRFHSVSLALTSCTINNMRKSVIDGQDYAATVTPIAGYTLDGATVSIKMGGMEMPTTYYKDGVIAIPNVTGDLVITVTAVATAAEPTNIIDAIGISANTRLSTSNGDNRAQTGYASIGANNDVGSLIRLSAGDKLRIKGASLPAANDTHSAVALYSADGTFMTATYLHDGLTWNAMTFANSGDMVIVTSTNDARIRVSVLCTDASAVVATINEKIT